jgi:membrane dipeptidase
LVLTNEPHRQATVVDLIKHIHHIVEVAGVDHVSLGPDFLDSNLAKRSSDYYVKGIDGISNLPHVTDALVENGYSDTDIRKIMGENILRVYKQVLG